MVNCKTWKQTVFFRGYSQVSDDYLKAQIALSGIDLAKMDSTKSPPLESKPVTPPTVPLSRDAKTRERLERYKAEEDARAKAAAEAEKEKSQVRRPPFGQGET